MLTMHTYRMTTHMLMHTYAPVHTHLTHTYLRRTYITTASCEGELARVTVASEAAVGGFG